MKLLLAVDPGPKKSGFALVERVGPRARWITGGPFASNRATFGRLLDGWEIDALAVEMPTGAIFQPFRAPGLLATAGVARAMLWEGERRCLQLVELSASDARKLVCGKANAPDAAVKDAVERNVIDFAGRSNVHTRDAALLALVATWKLAGVAGRRTA